MKEIKPIRLQIIDLLRQFKAQCVRYGEIHELQVFGEDAQYIRECSNDVEETQMQILNLILKLYEGD